MARKRMLDPGIWDDADFGSLKIEERLLFIGMLSHADDQGLGEADARVLRRAVFGFDDGISDADVEGWLVNIASRMRGVHMYSVDDRRYYFMKNWRKYQRVSHPSATRFPLPPDLFGVGSTVKDERAKFSRVMTKWSNAIPGMLTAAVADELAALAQDWDEHVKKLPDGNVDKPRDGHDVLIEAIAESVRSASRPSLSYVRAVMRSWIANGYKHRPGKNTSAKEKPNEALKAADLEAARKRKKK